MKKQNNSPLAEASTKFNVEAARLQIDLPMLEVILQTKAEVEALSAQAGLKIIHHFLEQEIEQCCGTHGQQSAYRHGRQAQLRGFCRAQGLDHQTAAAGQRRR